MWKKSRPDFTAAVITASDRSSRGEYEDLSGVILKEEIGRLGGRVVAYLVLPDDKETLVGAMCDLTDRQGVELILTTGGTGLGPRDVTPEATLAVVDRLVPGFPEAMRAASLKITPHGMLSREIAGLRNRTLIINLPGSPKAVRECFAVIAPALPHALETTRGGGQDHRPR